MPRQGSSNSGRRIPFPFNTENYIPVETLRRGASGRVYAPNRVVPTPEPPANPPSQAPVRIQENPIPHSGRVGDNWQDNVSRVLGPEYRMRWPDLTTMINDLEQHVRRQPGGRVVTVGQWTGEEIEQAGKLIAWGVPFVAIEALLGWPTIPISDEGRERVEYFIGEERKLLEGRR